MPTSSSPTVAIRHYWRQFNEIIPTLAMEGLSPETLAWLQSHPQWDSRVRLAHPANREAVMAALAQRGPQAYGGHPLASVDSTLVGSNDFDGLVGRTSQFNGFCRAAECKALDLAVMQFSFDLMLDIVPTSLRIIQADDKEASKKDGREKGCEEKGEGQERPKESLLDGIPEWFVGPLVAELVAHEVGHTLGLRHNFRASSIYTLEPNQQPGNQRQEAVRRFRDGLSACEYLRLAEQKETG